MSKIFVHQAAALYGGRQTVVTRLHTAIQAANPDDVLRHMIEIDRQLDRNPSLARPLLHGAASLIMANVHMAQTGRILRHIQRETMADSPESLQAARGLALIRKYSSARTPAAATPQTHGSPRLRILPTPRA